MRESYIAISSTSVDVADAKDMNIKILQFVLRSQMSDVRLYHKPCDKLAIDEDMQRARINFARLYKQCDVMAILPRPELGIVRHTLPLNPFPIPKSIRKAMRSTYRHQLAIIVAKVSESSANFAIYSSSFGIQLAVSLPTISVIYQISTPIPHARLYHAFARSTVRLITTHSSFVSQLAKSALPDVFGIISKFPSDPRYRRTKHSAAIMCNVSASELN